MNFSNITKVLKKHPSYRFKQVKRALFCNAIEKWDQAYALPAILREDLEKKAALKINYRLFKSEKEQVIKALIALEDGVKIESVLMRHKGNRNTVCVSSQAGCSVGCTFCATGQMKFKRDLTASEIVEQVILFLRYLKKSGQKVTNIVFMGMGEPFFNYDNVMEAICILHDPDGLNMGGRRFSISTVGIINGIERLSKEKLEINLAISLHAPSDSLRSRIIPINKQYSISKIINSVEEYIAKTNRRVMFEYVMIRDFNDSEENARQLAALMKEPLYFVNLISYNPTSGRFAPSTPAAVRNFKNILERAGVNVTQRYRFGQDIKAACGQLAGED